METRTSAAFEAPFQHTEVKLHPIDSEAHALAVKHAGTINAVASTVPTPSAMPSD